MKRALAVVALLAAAGAVGMLLAAATTGAGARARPPRPGPAPHVFAFLSGAGGPELSHLRRYGARIDVLAPNWFTAHLGDGRIGGAPQPQVRRVAAAERVALWPVVNAPATGDTLATPGVRDRLATAITGLAARYRFPGVTLDLEALPASQSGALARLVTLVAARLHAGHRRLAVYVPRRTAHGGDAAYDWRALAGAADLLIASGYNEHSADGPPGPITTARGFIALLRYAAGISRRRVAPAIGAFGYRWPADGGTGALISSVAADRWRRQAGARLQGAGGDASFRAAGAVVHYQTATALMARAGDARAAGMRWLALFSLGREPDAFWAALPSARPG